MPRSPSQSVSRRPSLDLRIIIHRKALRALAVNPCRHYVSETDRRRSPDNDKGYDRKSRSRNRFPRAARPACPHHARLARHVAKSAGESLRHFRTLYRPARKRQGQRLDRAVAPGLERDGRASRRPHSRGRTRARLARGADVSGVTDPFAVEAAALSADGRTAYLDVTYDVDKLTATQLDDAISVTAEAADDGVQIELTGALALLAQETPSSELIGVGVAVIVLLVAFGSVVAMGLPIITALVALGTGLSLVTLATHIFDTSNFTPALAAMIGLGVGIDYALFIATRFRAGLRSTTTERGLTAT